jgi:osmotically-inducible protein OsmY
MSGAQRGYGYGGEDHWRNEPGSYGSMTESSGDWRPQRDDRGQGQYGQYGGSSATQSRDWGNQSSQSGRWQGQQRGMSSGYGERGYESSGHGGSQGYRGESGGYGGARADYDQQRRGRAPRAYRRSDQRIGEDLYEQLSQSDLDAIDIVVVVDACCVTLSGTVPERWMKHRIEDLADNTFGVQNVDNQIRVTRDDQPGTREGHDQGAASQAGRGGTSQSQYGTSGTTGSQAGATGSRSGPGMTGSSSTGTGSSGTSQMSGGSGTSGTSAATGSSGSASSGSGSSGQSR